MVTINSPCFFANFVSWGTRAHRARSEGIDRASESCDSPPRSRRPVHTFPLRADPVGDGTAGQTEAAIDLSRCGICIRR